MSALQLLCKPRTWAPLLVVCLLLETSQGQKCRIYVIQSNKRISALEKEGELKAEGLLDIWKKCREAPVNGARLQYYLANDEYHPDYVTYTVCFCGTDKSFRQIQTFGEDDSEGSAAFS